jgi:hypothetical protein
VVFKRRSEQLAAKIRGSVLQIVKGAGHMVHHLAARQVVEAVESVAKTSQARVVAGEPAPSRPASRDQPAAA